MKMEWRPVIVWQWSSMRQSVLKKTEYVMITVYLITEQQQSASVLISTV
jgi:hypothetical protein